MRKRHSFLTALMALSAAAVLLSGCSMVKTGLSSEEEEALSSDIGTASIGGDTWYFNGSADTDISAVTGDTLVISFSKAVSIDTANPVSGSFALSWTDASGNATSKTIAIATSDSSLPGTLSSDKKSYYLKMAPVTAILDGTTVPDGEADLSIQLSGFLCAEGDETGRSIPSLKQKIAIAPLFLTDVESAIPFSTVFSTVAKSIAILSNGTVTLEDATDFSVAATSGSTLPDGLDATDFTIAASSSGLSVTCSQDLQGKSFSMDLTVNGITSVLCATAQSRTFTIACNPVLITMDGNKDANWTDSAASVWATDATDDARTDISWGDTSGAEISGLFVTNDSTYLYVALSGNFSDVQYGHICFLFDTSTVTGGATSLSGMSTGSWTAPAGTALSVSNGEVDFLLNHDPGAGSGSTADIYLYQMTSSTNDTDVEVVSSWSSSAAPDALYASPYIWINGAQTSGFVEYRIPLTSLGSLSSGSTVKLFGITSEDWKPTYAADVVPGSTIPTANTDSIALDFAGALSYTIK